MRREKWLSSKEGKVPELVAGRPAILISGGTCGLQVKTSWNTTRGTFQKSELPAWCAKGQQVPVNI